MKDRTTKNKAVMNRMIRKAIVRKRKRRVISIILCCILLLTLIGCLLSLVGCSNPVQVNVSNNDNISSNQFGTFIKIGNNLFYDSATRIVYTESHTYYGCTYSAYYAPNGLPYRYNTETNTFEEIE